MLYCVVSLLMCAFSVVCLFAAYLLSVSSVASVFAGGSNEFSCFLVIAGE